MVKNFEAISESKSLSDEDLALINKQSLKKLTKEDVFTFSVILCDNEIDRDFEVFSVQSLKALKELFVGKTGILNHSNRSEDQSSRTYKTELITDETKLTSYGEKYTYLKAWCYTVKSTKNEDLIKDIESGIKKEVSISCNFSEKVCSVCGESFCSHKSGRFYGDTLCYKTIDGVTDAYEWSFVAVPAQRGAGVTKTAKTIREMVELSEKQSEASFAKMYRNELKMEAKKGFSVAFPELSGKTAEAIINNLNASDLLELSKALKQKTAKLYPIYSQFSGEGVNDKDTNSQFSF